MIVPIKRKGLVVMRKTVSVLVIGIMVMELVKEKQAEYETN